jgi:hypothetical protein
MVYLTVFGEKKNFSQKVYTYVEELRHPITKQSSIGTGTVAKNSSIPVIHVTTWGYE